MISGCGSENRLNWKKVGCAGGQEVGRAVRRLLFIQLKGENGLDLSDSGGCGEK